jgi:prefoldin subunit 5
MAAPDATKATVDPKMGELDSNLFKLSSANKRNIPEAIFIEKVENLCQQYGQPTVAARLQELYSKYQYMQSSLTAQRSGLKAKLPDISTALETVTHLIDRRDRAQDEETRDYTYQLSENIFATAAVPASNSVCLWLGANCMLEYTLDEAIELLRTNEANAKTTLASVEEDMAFLRDQITTTEVNIARSHNYGVKERAKAKEDQAGAAASADASGGGAKAGSSNFSPPPREGKGPGYTWKQDKDEVEVHVPCPEGAKKSDVKVTILVDSLRIEHAGTTLLEGELAGKCRPDGSTWTMTGSRVDVTLEKAESAMWKGLMETAS